MLTPDSTLLTLQYQADLGLLTISWLRAGSCPRCKRATTPSQRPPWNMVPSAG
jgi:hypothetical protein